VEVVVRVRVRVVTTFAHATFAAAAHGVAPATSSVATLGTAAAALATCEGRGSV